MVFGIIPECRSDSFRNERSASLESPIVTDNTGYRQESAPGPVQPFLRVARDPTGAGGSVNAARPGVLYPRTSHRRRVIRRGSNGGEQDRRYRHRCLKRRVTEVVALLINSVYFAVPSTDEAC